MNAPTDKRVTAISAAQWRQIVNSARDTAVISTDTGGRVTSWNTGAANLLFWTEEEMLGETLDRLFTPEDRARGQLAKEMADARTLGRGGGEEGWRLRKDGTRFWAAGEMAPILEDSALFGYIKILRDRTEQRKAEEIIREERATLEILKSRRLGSCARDRSAARRPDRDGCRYGIDTRAEFGAFFYNVLNEAGENYMLYTLSGAPLEAFAKFPMPRNTQVFAPTFGGEGIVRSDDITQDPRYGHNAPRKGMPKGHLPVRSYLAVPVVSRSGEVIGGLFFGHARAGVFTEHSERGLLGLAAEAAVAIDNARLSKSIQKELAERIRAQDALSQLNANLENEVAERTRQLQKNEEVLRQSQKMEAIGHLTGGVAHDFNNLLQIIIGNLETLQRNIPADSGRLQRAVLQAINGARRAASLTQRLLAFSRRQPLDPKPLDVNMLVSGMSDLLQRTLGETVSLETVHGAGIWRIEADSNELEAAILNLAVNARDAMTPDGGRLTIETANAHIDEGYAYRHAEVAPGQYVALSVTDTGAGMDTETLAQAFEPFFTTKPVGKGTGLGLSQVYGFVKQSGGHVKIYSELGQGTTVKIYLPRWVGETTEIETAKGVPVPEGTREETILVIEDEEDVRAYTCDTLRELGYRVIEAADGPSALRLLEREDRVDLLFTDVVLPGGMTGAQVAARASARRPAIKILFTTGYARNAIIHQGRLDKGVELITKPFSFADLAARVRDILDRKARPGD